MRGRALLFVKRCRAGSAKWRRVRSELDWPRGSHAPRRSQGRRGGSLGDYLGDLLWLCQGSRAISAARGEIARLRDGDHRLRRIRWGTVFGVASFQVDTRRDRINSEHGFKETSAAHIALPLCAVVSGTDIQLPPNHCCLDYSVKVTQALITDYSLKVM